MLDKVGTVSIDKCEGTTVILSRQSLEAEVVSAKSSELNIQVRPQAPLTRNTDTPYRHHPLPSITLGLSLALPNPNIHRRAEDHRVYQPYSALPQLCLPSPPPTLTRFRNQALPAPTRARVLNSSTCLRHRCALQMPGATDGDEFTEVAIPEQFVSKMVNGKWVTECMAHTG